MLCLCCVGSTQWWRNADVSRWCKTPSTHRVQLSREQAGHGTYRNYRQGEPFYTCLRKRLKIVAWWPLMWNVTSFTHRHGRARNAPWEACKGHLRMCLRKGRSNAPAWACLKDKNVKNRISFTIKTAKAAGEAVGARVRHRSWQGAGGSAWLRRASPVFALEIASC